MMFRSLHTAILNNQPIQEFSRDVTKAAKEGLLNVPDSRGLTALQLASREGDFFKTFELISAGALDTPLGATRLSRVAVGSLYRVEAEKSPFTLAYERGNIQVAMLLMVCSRSMGTFEERTLLKRHPNYLHFLNGFLFRSVQGDDLLVLKKLIVHLQSFTEVEMRPHHRKIYGLITLAVRLEANIGIIEELLKVIGPYQSTEKRSALYWAAFHQNIPLYKHLVARGADEFSTLRLLYDEKKHRRFARFHALLSETRKKEYAEQAPKITFNKPQRISDLQGKIYEVASQGKHDSLIDFCNDEKDAAAVLSDAMRADNYVVIDEVLCLPLRSSHLFSLIAGSGDIEMLTLFCCSNASLENVMQFVADLPDLSFLDTVISNLWSVKGLFQAIFRAENVKLFHDIIQHLPSQFSTTAGGEEKQNTTNLESEVNLALCRHIQDKTAINFREVIVALSESFDMRRVIRHLTLTPANQNLVHVLKRYGTKYRIDIGIESETKEEKFSPLMLLGDDAWSNITNFLGDIEIGRMAGASRQFQQIASNTKVQSQKNQLLHAKQAEIKQIDECLTRIEDELKSKGFCDQNPVLWAYIPCFIILFTSLALTGWFAKRVNDGINSGERSSTDLALLCLSVSVFVGLCVSPLLWKRGVPGLNRNNYEHFSRKPFSALSDSHDLVLEIMNKYENDRHLNLTLQSTSGDVINTFKELKRTLKMELGILSLTMPHSSTLFVVPRAHSRSAVINPPMDHILDVAGTVEQEHRAGNEPVVDHVNDHELPLLGRVHR